MHCEICSEDVDFIYRHHIVPKMKGGTNGATVKCCKTCNSQVHMMFNEKALASMTLSDLIGSEKMQKYIKWKHKHPGDHGHKMSRDVKRWKKYHR